MNTAVKRLTVLSAAVATLALSACVAVPVSQPYPQSYPQPMPQQGAPQAQYPAGGVPTYPAPAWVYPGPGFWFWTLDFWGRGHWAWRHGGGHRR